MSVLEKLERKFGRFGIPGLMRYIILINILGAIIFYVDKNLYYEYLSLDVQKILSGQVWRLISFVLVPPNEIGNSGMIAGILMFALWTYINYHIGMTLERVWGTFSFTLFYFTGLVLMVLAAFVTYIISYDSSELPEVNQAVSMGIAQMTNLVSLDNTIFLSLALLFPELQFMVYFVLPVKAKWLVALYVAMEGYRLYEFIRTAIEVSMLSSSVANIYYYGAALIVLALLNCILFFVLGRRQVGIKTAYKTKKRKSEFRKQAQNPIGPRHKCAICGRTEKDVPSLEFRYCSKCEGSYEYCSEHLFTHEHVHR